MDNLNIFDLCNEFDDLSLDDNGGEEPSSSSSSSSSSSRGLVPKTFRRLLHSCVNSSLNMEMSQQLRAPFIDLPRHFVDLPSFDSYDISMGFGFRFLPGQAEFLIQELKFPEEFFGRFSFLSERLGLSYIKTPLNIHSMVELCGHYSGIKGFFIPKEISKILVEVVTCYNGEYGRFLVLVCLGVGCTVWQATAQGSFRDNIWFKPFDTYDPFFNMGHVARGFKRLGFVEKEDVTSSVLSAFENEQPFAEVEIPLSGNMLTAAGLGVMVAFFLAVGIVPNFSS